MFKKLVLTCLAFLWLAFFQPTADSERLRQSEAIYPRGVESCRVCHQAIFDTFIQTAHFKTSSRAGASSIKGEGVGAGTGTGAFSDGRNILRTRTAGVFFKMERRGADFYQTAIEAAIDSSENRSRTERFDIVIGSGRKGQSYLYWRDGLLFQLPVSYLTGIEEWINSPGYVDGQINFERVIQPRCLECHSASFKLELAGGKPRYSSDYELGINCAKCHGEGDQHVAYQSAHPTEKGAEKEGKHILNPARFPRERQLDNCALCHSGAWDPKKPPFSYQPGQRLDEYAPAGAGEANSGADVHGNQIALLRQSKCFRASPAMSCSTCHNVHQQERDLVQLAQKCLSCHQTGQCKFAAKVGPQIMNYCIDCHMPNRKSNLIRINTAAKQFAPEYRSHAIGVYRQVAEAALYTILGKHD
ncbi:MAG TPA: multiheme c-type cytochrome [Blastocatellia bacterium]|nr:multiheme c-type cytochrome [Blastocatellia bacterium]